MTGAHGVSSPWNCTTGLRGVTAETGVHRQAKLWSSAPGGGGRLHRASAEGWQRCHHRFIAHLPGYEDGAMGRRGGELFLVRTTPRSARWCWSRGHRTVAGLGAGNGCMIWSL